MAAVFESNDPKFLGPFVADCRAGCGGGCRHRLGACRGQAEFHKPAAQHESVRAHLVPDFCRDAKRRLAGGRLF